jgi:hypothetical protein
MKKQGSGKGFGFPNDVYLDSFIWKSEVSDGHCVYLGIGRKYGESDQWKLHTFDSIVKAWDCLSKVKKLLTEFSYLPSQSSDDIALNFYSVLAKNHPELNTNNSNGSHIVVGDENVIKDWQEAGNVWGVDTPPPGVEVTVVGPLYFSKYKVLEVPPPIEPKIKEIDIKVGNPNSFFWYIIGESQTKVFGNEVLAFDGYITAAYVVDYINREKKESLTQDEYKRLVLKAHQMQGKDVDTVIELPRYYQR